MPKSRYTGSRAKADGSTSRRREELRYRLQGELQEDGMPYLKLAKAVAFLILNVVQIVNMAQSTAYTIRTLRRKR